MNVPERPYTCRERRAQFFESNAVQSSYISFRSALMCAQRWALAPLSHGRMRSEMGREGNL
ncbi:hypothetical protein FIBSPDRAFT_855197 [Athelia psychrophila]|uniref:Uncharacterized protein n=1 Tax=Athelia psychrophila TaxID=1759441 RepID=A0A166PB16_9AGAM|nr:hypothetical protein FIBSPDRAFT_855197 [Fibularhizoctonia sp. CBS 109695]